ncbi:type II toxin-antitoxin system antitoxin SocA domain-containing protein [Bacillus thermotolerans]|uniref:Prophage ps3 protein 01 n=1 Tax=Bacillus thermotolerans TaxID=1221996 RepID=A0A0F5HMA9_BACTR|nr:type II toxin-antitoxin system antitoxin SocA domain-containing protein [Bacillus thermotolerans]KKB34160.1 prophage ps3 protein 01 [Bacillus thermotolerans]
MLPFCGTCEDIVDFEEKFINKRKIIKGREINYTAKEAHCTECGSLLFVPKVHDYNLKRINDAYREAEGLITVEEIEKAINMYNIGKRPLSLILGWGEGTVTRYLNGDMPTKQYSQTLKRILEDLNVMEELLEENKHKVTGSAYSNCKEAIQELKRKKSNGFVGDQKKIDNVIQYLLLKCEEITPLALQKLLYYSQAFSYAINKEFLFDDDCEAWVHGPVYRNIYEKYKNYGYNPIEEELDHYNFELLTNEERELLDSIVNNFGCYSGKILEEMTHIEAPWKEARKGFSDNEPSNQTISKDTIKKYFNDIKNKYQMVNVADIRDYSEDIFQKTHL